MEKKKKCIICGGEFTTVDGRVKLCSDKCRLEYKQYYIKKTKKEKNGIEGIDYVTCKWCGEKVKRIYGKHINTYHKGKTTLDYKKEFPGFSLTCLSDKQNTSKNSGKHMKQEKYRVLFSEKIKGEKNPNHKSKTSVQCRKENSPFSKEYYEKRGISENNRIDFINRALKNRKFETTLQYWIEKGYTEFEAQKKLKERQTTFSLKKCIEKYGKEKGLERWKKRQEKWLKNYPFNNYSKISQILFKQIYEKIKDEFKEIYFAECIDNGKNNEYRLNLKDRIILPDFFIKDIRKIIEFDGIYWHKNTPENKTREMKKDIAIIENDYDILHIREDDFIKDPDKEIKKCIEFIYEKTN